MITDFFSKSPTIVLDGESHVAESPLFTPDFVRGLESELEPVLQNIVQHSLWKTFSDVIKGFLTDVVLSIRFPHHNRLFQLAVTFPLGTACVERCFSKMKLIKNRLRSSMQEPHLDDLMMISSELPLDASFRIPDEFLDEIVEGYRTGLQSPDTDADGRNRVSKFASFNLYGQMLERIVSARNASS